MSVAIKCLWLIHVCYYHATLETPVDVMEHNKQAPPAPCSSHPAGLLNIRAGCVACSTVHSKSALTQTGQLKTQDESCSGFDPPLSSSGLFSLPCSIFFSILLIFLPLGFLTSVYVLFPLAFPSSFSR